MSHDLSQPIRPVSEKAQKLRDAPAKEGSHSVGVWTLKMKKKTITEEVFNQISLWIFRPIN